jgi:hypothetical protein
MERFPARGDFGDEPAALALLVEGKVLIHKVDAVAETGELGSEFLQCLEALDAAGSAATTSSAMVASRRPNWTRRKSTPLHNYSNAAHVISFRGDGYRLSIACGVHRQVR